MNNKHKATQAVHSGMTSTSQSHGVNTPIYPSSAFQYRGHEEVPYPRYYNTNNQKIVADKLAILENGESAMLFSSGMAAISTSLFALLHSGDHVLFYSQLYGGTFNLIMKEFSKRGIDYTMVDNEEAQAFEKALRPTTKLIYIETPTNPLMSIVNMAAITSVARSNGCLTMIDNTFASPINQNPIDHGFDVVIHSGTKYLGGHSDLCFGAVISSSQIISQIHQTAINYGGSLNALDLYLIERSLKTLSIRVETQNRNAMQMASFLSEQDEIKEVYYPGLSSHPNHRVAVKQMTGFGGMLSFEFKSGNYEDAGKFLDSLQVIQPAVSLGGVETIICSPVDTSHAKMPKDTREQLGISDTLIRMSLGIERIEDLMKDVKQALASIPKPILV